MLRDAERESGLRFSQAAPDLVLLEPEVETASGSDPLLTPGTISPDPSIAVHGGIIPVLKCEVEDNSTNEEIRILNETLDKMRNENRNLNAKISKLESQTSCDLSQVFVCILSSH